MRTLNVMLLALLLAAQAQSNLSETAPSQMLSAHNEVRHQLGLPLLRWSDELARIAQTRAEMLLAFGNLKHSSRTSYGENLYQIDGAAASPQHIVDYWTAEAGNYDYAANACDASCGHFTQIAWRTTRRLGCGMAQGDRRQVWVCEYDPPGNWLGRRPY